MADAEASGIGVPLVIAIDGPSGVGKSTVARLLAQHYALPMLDTGAMYRAAALAVLDQSIALDDEATALAAALAADVSVRGEAGGVTEVLLDGQHVGSRIRSPEVSDATSRLAIHQALRERMVKAQRAFARRQGAVIEGRDIGTVVFPQTPFKFFLDAAPEIRAERRAAELRAAGREIDVTALAAEIARRDARDSQRAASPLICDDRYEHIDTGSRTPTAVVDVIVASIAARAERGHPTLSVR